MKTFYNILTNTLIASITNFTVWFALIFYVYLQTSSVLATSIMSGIYLIATSVSGFWLGSIIDHNKKRTVMLFSSIMTLFIYIISFFIYITAPENAFSDIKSITLWIFVPLVLFGVLAGNLRNIALPTLVALLVTEDRRDKANGMVGTASGISFLIVSVISGFLVAHSGMYLALILAIIFNIIVIMHLWFIDIQEKEIVHLEGHSSKIDIKGTISVLKLIPGLLALILFTTFNNFLGGVFMSLMDAYGLSMISVEKWGILWGFLSLGFIIGGLIISKKGLGKNPLRSMFIANIIIWTITCFFAIQPSILLLTVGMFIYLCVVPFIEASEHTIIQKVVPQERLGRVFGFAQSVEQAASPLTAFLIGPIAQFIFIPFMTTGKGVDLIGNWFGIGPDRGIALVFTITGIIGLICTLLAMNSKYYKQLSKQYIPDKTLNTNL